MISKFDHDSERFKIAIDLRSKLLICQWLTDSFLLCRRHSDYLSERKFESNAILRKIINEEIRNEDFRKTEMIFKNKNNSWSSQQEKLIVSKLLHLQNDDKISFRRNENFENIFSENLTNQWDCEKLELEENLCFSTTNEIIELCSDHFQTRHSLCDCKNSFNFWETRIRIMWWSQIKWLFIWMTLRILSLNFQKNSQKFFCVRATQRSQMTS
jgi:hypothetical protein